MNELITGPMPYAEAIPVLIKVLHWIDENGWTTDKCAFQFSISFDNKDRKLENNIKCRDCLNSDKRIKRNSNLAKDLQ